MLPGKTYRPEDYLVIALRRKWLIVVPLCVCAAIAFLYARSLPNRYRSESMILILPQLIPKDYVKPPVTMAIGDRLLLMKEQILSRTRLDAMIREFNLYPQSQRATRDDLIDRLHGAINFAPVERRGGEGAGAFKLGFEYGEPRTAMLVTERLASLFVNENVQDREVQATTTNLFLDGQLNEARERLAQHDKKLEAYRRAHAGELPSQQQSNMAVIQTAGVQLQSLQATVTGDRERRIALDRQLAEVRSTETVAPVDTANSASAPVSAAARLPSARAVLESLEQRLAAGHPDIKHAKRVVADLERDAKLEAQQAAEESPERGSPVVLSAAESAKRARIRDIEADLSRLDRRLAANQAEEERLNRLIAEYQRRVDAAPLRETELLALTRDSDTFREMYAALLRNRESSKMALDLERQQVSEKFRVMDPASLPQKPFSPDRMRLMLMGLLAGLCAGVGLVAFREYQDSTFRTDADVVIALSLPVLAAIPFMPDPRPAWWRRLIIGTVILTVTAGGTLWWRWGAAISSGWIR